MRVMWHRWGACGKYDNPPVSFANSLCRSTFNSVFNSTTNALRTSNIIRDTTAGGYMGGVRQRSCRSTSQGGGIWASTAPAPANNLVVNAPFLCFWVNPANADGNMADAQPWNGSSGSSPFAAPFMSYRQGGTQFVTWPKTTAVGITTSITKWVSGSTHVNVKNGRANSALTGWHRGRRNLQVLQCPYDPTVGYPVCTWTSHLANADL